MMETAVMVKNGDFLTGGQFGAEGTCALERKLEKGIRSIKNGEVYTIENAWEEIDKI